jgi:hypothetical protein
MNPFRQFLRSFNAAFLGSYSTEKNIFLRAWRTAVLWSWGFSFLRVASILILLPLLTRLPAADFGFYYLLLSIVAVTPLVDLGFAASVERAVSYAMAGASQLRAKGSPIGETSGAPNFGLFWKLVQTARLFYRMVTILLLVLLGTVGTYIVSQSAAATTNPQLAWIAWGIALLNAGFEVYASWWNVVLRGMNQVVTSTRIFCLGYALKLILSSVLLILGCGVLSIFAAGLVASAVIRSLSRSAVRRAAPAPPADALPRDELIGLFRTLWPNSWRIGLQLISTYVMALLLMLICKEKFELAGAGQYGFSLNIAAVIQAIASVWVTVKWPAIQQLRSRNDVAAIQRLFWGRIWLETLTFIGLAALAILVTPFLLKIGGLQKEVLPAPWFLVLLLNAFLETQMIIWGTLLTTENKVPTLWPIALSNALTVVLVMVLLEKTSIQLGAFALAPLIVGALFNYWYWPRRGPRNLGSTWMRYMFRPPHLGPNAARSGSVPSIA